MKKPRFPAPRACQPPFLAFAFALALGSTHAPGWYMPQTGRWLNRDPIGHEGGANIYAAAENDPVNKGDALGLWTQVYRLKEPWAQVCADSENDTWESLAKKIKLDPREASQWVRNHDATPKQGTTYQVPNRMVVFTTPFDSWGATGANYMRQAAIIMGDVLESQGYGVKRITSTSKADFIGGWREEGLGVFVFGGHGVISWTLRPLGPDVGTPVSPNEVSPRHKLMSVAMFACFSSGEQHDVGFDDGGHPVYSPAESWRKHVAPGGVFLGYPGPVWFWNAPFPRTQVVPPRP